MKITIDTLKKTITVHENPTMADLLAFMKEHYPTNWQSFKFKEPIPTVVDNSITNNYYGDEIDTGPSIN
jgi:hypothetical protein